MTPPPRMMTSPLVFMVSFYARRLPKSLRLGRSGRPYNGNNRTVEEHAMPGIKITTKLDPATCLKVAYRAARDLGFSLTPMEAACKRFTATKGSALMSMIVGSFSPHCRFEISAESYADGNEVVLEKNTPWLMTGSVGVSKVNKQADDLMAAIACAIEKEGGKILERKEF
jgi:hypothetical protein